MYNDFVEHDIISYTLSKQSTAVLNSPFCSHWLACANRLLMSLVTLAPHSLSYSACTSSSLAGKYSRHDFKASTHIPFSCNTTRHFNYLFLLISILGMYFIYLLKRRLYANTLYIGIAYVINYNWVCVWNDVRRVETN